MSGGKKGDGTGEGNVVVEGGVVGGKCFFFQAEDGIRDISV